MREARLSADLPERFCRLYIPRSGKFETPLDPQGIADIDAVFELAIRTYPDTLPPFDSGERNKHHLYWTEEWWKQYANNFASPDKETIQEFRDSTPQIAYLPVPIHAWIEEIMEPPPPPPIEVMRQRNAAWQAAKILLNEAMRLDEARERYEIYKDKSRVVLGCIDGITPRSRQRTEPVIEIIDTEYWLSELNGRLNGWRQLAGIQEGLPAEARIIPLTRLSYVRALRHRIRKGAIVPKMPAAIIAA